MLPQAACTDSTDSRTHAWQRTLGGSLCRKLVTRVQHAHAASSRCLEAGEALGAGGAHGDDPEHVEPDGLGQGPEGQWEHISQQQ
jgi:hypothetical protein